MPTLRRSKSLNDKISRQKNRAADVVRDPRSPDVEGRTRTNVDNFQALVHLRKQTEDKARQLELAYSYATNGHTYLRRGPSGGVELPYPSPTSPTAKTPQHSSSEAKPPIPVLVPRRQHSAEGRCGDRSSVLRRQESSESPNSSSSSGQNNHQHQSRRDQRKAQRPLSMVEPRGGNLFPTQEELSRKEQVIQNLTESQRSLNAHNQKLLSKVDELEFENQRLRELLSRAPTPHLPSSSSPYSPPPPLAPHFPNTRPHRSISLHGDALKVSGSHSGHALISPHSETSVSGYGSLVDSPSGEVLVSGPEVSRVGPRTGVGEEDDDTLPLSGVSECSVEYGHDTLEKTSSSAESSSRGSRAATLNSDRSEGDSTSGGRRRKKRGEEEEEEEEGKNPRIEELAKQVAELSSQRDTVLFRYKQLVQDSLRVMKRDRRVQDELCSLLEKHGHCLEETLVSELYILREQLTDLSENVQAGVQEALKALDSADPGPLGTSCVPDTLDPAVRDTLDRLVDLIGSEYQRLARRLTVPQEDLDRVERSSHLPTPALKTQALLKQWLRRRGGAGGNGGGTVGGAEVPPAVRHLEQALRDVDKDLLHCQHCTVSGPERQALKNCLQSAVDQVGDPRDVLDHLIALNELSPPAIAFVQEVLEKRERAVCRLWHVAEYRGTGMVSRLALALDRSHCPQLAHTLRDELEIQNSRLHTQCHPASQDPPPDTHLPPTPSPITPPPLESQASTSQARSRSRVPRLRSKTFDSPAEPAKSPPEGPTSAAGKVRPPPPLRQASLTGTERQNGQRERPASVIMKERPTSMVQKDRADPASAKERNLSASRKIRRQTSQQSERSALPVPRDRSFSPSCKNKSTPKPAVAAQKDRPLSSVVKDNGKPDPAAKNDIHTQKERPFSPFEKDKSGRPFSPFEKDKSTRPFSPFENNKIPRPFSPCENKPARCFSPFDRQKSTPAAAQPGRTSVQSPRDRPFSPLQRDKAVISYHKDRAAPRERGNASRLVENQTSGPVEERSAPQPPKDTQAVWDRRSSACSSVGATAISNARNSVVLEQGGKISRV